VLGSERRRSDFNVVVVEAAAGPANRSAFLSGSILCEDLPERSRTPDSCRIACRQESCSRHTAIAPKPQMQVSSRVSSRGQMHPRVGGSSAFRANPIDTHAEARAQAHIGTVGERANRVAPGLKKHRRAFLHSLHPSDHRRGPTQSAVGAGLVSAVSSAYWGWYSMRRNSAIRASVSGRREVSVVIRPLVGHKPGSCNVCRDLTDNVRNAATALRLAANVSARTSSTRSREGHVSS
jgi:hypothetical protein